MDCVQELVGMRPGLLRYAQQRLRNREQAEDAVQEALLAALEGLDGFSGASSLRTWVGGILKHKLADLLRGAMREELTDMDERELPESDPHARLERWRFLETVASGLGRLPERTASAFVMREVLGMDTPEVCRRLSITSTHCCVMVHRARRRLRALVPHEL